MFKRFNVAPSQQVAAVRVFSEDGARELVPLRWGLIPSRSKEPRTEYSTINARAETVEEKPAYRTAFRQRRCLILADGFFEWSALPEGGKQPWYVALADGGLFAFAGLWERWEPRTPADEPVESCTIIVTDANELMQRIHNRMPVILAPADYDIWLNPRLHDPAPLRSLLKPFDATKDDDAPGKSASEQPQARRSGLHRAGTGSDGTVTQHPRRHAPAPLACPAPVPSCQHPDASL